MLRSVPVCWRSYIYKQECRVRMFAYNLQLLAYSFAVLATLAMLVKHERRLKRWLLRSRKRRRRHPASPLTVR